MRIKSLLSVIAGCIISTSVNAGVPIPTDEPVLVFNSRAGAEQVETNRRISLYFKCSEPNSTVYVQWGDSTEAQEVIIATANLNSKLVTIEKIKVPDMEVKVAQAESTVHGIDGKVLNLHYENYRSNMDVPS